MCGIAGIFAYRSPAPLVDESELLRIRDSMIKRGPDGAGLWVADDRRVALAHRRLAIIDLSDAGAQPMATTDGRLHVTFNGEIYNFRELRKELEGKGFVFRTSSDTEVLLHLYRDRGYAMVHALRGMFAFGLWDCEKQHLLLARDPFGIKPLYYADDGGAVRFASQVKALLQSARVDVAPEPAGAVGFLIWGAVPEPFTLYRGIKCLPAGSFAIVGSTGVDVRQYVSVKNELQEAQIGSDFSAKGSEALGEALRDSVSAHLIADVPVGVFLSAGLDSALVATLAQHGRIDPLKAITLGFAEYRGTKADEVPIAKVVAQQLGAAHQIETITRSDFVREREAIIASMDQPSIDGINTYFVSRAAAHAGLKVAISGLGGDEIFGGYSSFVDVPRLARLLGAMRWLPRLGKLFRIATAPVFRRVTSSKFSSIFEYGGSYEEAYLLRRALFLPWEIRDHLDPSLVQAGLRGLMTVDCLREAVSGLKSPHARIASLEITWYMRNQLLRDADWAGMAHSLEIRLPLVDIKLFRAISPLLVRANGLSKQDALATLPIKLPLPVIEREKSGFGTPIRDWLAIDDPEVMKMRGLRRWAICVLPHQPKVFRALTLISDAFGGKGGIAKFNRDFLSSMSAMPACGEVVVVPRLIQTDMGVLPPRITYVSEAAKGKVRFIWSAIAQALDGPFDVVISGHINLAPLAFILSKFASAKSAMVIHGIDAWAPHRSGLVRASVRQFDRIISVSQVTGGRFLDWSKVDPSRIVILPNCVSLDQFTDGPRSEFLARKLGVDDMTVLLTVGRLSQQERYKGFDEVIRALPELRKTIPALKYVICGEGPDRPRLEALVEKFKVNDNVVFAGFIPEDQKADYYRIADAYVMPSSGEGFGIVFLEAMACGVPVMGSILDGGREALLDGRLGVLVNPRVEADVVDGIRRTLARTRGVPPGLDSFSNSKFRERVSSIVMNLLGGGS